jgi:putative hemolysin
MELEIALTLLLLLVLSLLATVDMAFGQLSDVGLRRLIGENGEKPEARSRVFLKQVLENRPRFGFALSATIQILLVVVAVLITSISLTLFPNKRLVLVGLVAGLILAGIFRQLVPLFIATRNPEATLLFLLPIIRPFFPVMAFLSDPFQSLFDRSRRNKDQVTEEGEEEEEDDDSGDLQALIDVGEAEGILEEEEGELIHSIIEFGV